MDQVTNQILFIKWVLRRDTYVLRSGRWSSRGVSQSGGVLRAFPSLVRLSGRLPVWWSSQGALQPPVPPGASVNADLTQLPEFFGRLRSNSTYLRYI